MNFFYPLNRTLLELKYDLPDQLIQFLFPIIAWTVNGWPEGSLKSTNLSGLRFLPSGTRAGWDGKFDFGNGKATFWTGQKDFNGYPFLGLLQGSGDFLSVMLSFSRNDGYSVRCVKE